MISFESDYEEGAHPDVLKELMRSNYEQMPGYGLDRYSEYAKGLIKAECKSPDADVYFLVNGTQTNTVIISSILRPHQAVISANTGHVSLHEAGAIESTGHKVLPVDSLNGKINSEQIKKIMKEHWSNASREHTVQPGLVYISQPTELGTVYTKDELIKLNNTCKEWEIPLFIDGARLAYSLVIEEAVTLSEIANLCDVFYFGGTKTGALLGEAVIITNKFLKEDFKYIIKQQGGLLPKGRLLGIQFKIIFEERRFLFLAKNAVESAMAIRKAFESKGISMKYDSLTNQQFPILPKKAALSLENKYIFKLWEKNENMDTYRFCTSWATKKDAVKQLVNDIKKIESIF